MVPLTKLAARILMLAVACSLPALEAPLGRDGLTWRFAGALAQSTDKDAEEKQGFENAKELGTVEAWDAFIANYPKGFRADLARAYAKKVAAPAAANTSPPPPAETTGPLSPAEELPCSLASRLRSESSVTAARITFFNATGSPRTVRWINFDGRTEQIARLEPGEERSQETYLTHPWMVMNENGECGQIFKPVGRASLARIEIEDQGAESTPEPAAKRTNRNDDDDDDEPRRKKRAANDDDSKPAKSKSCPKGLVRRSGVCINPQKAEKSAAANCKELGLAYVGGKCVAKAKVDKQRYQTQKKKGCPAGTYLNPLGVCQPNETGG